MPCYPAYPIDSNGNQNPGAEPLPAPQLDGPGCPYPGNTTATGGEGAAFPTYYTITRCSDRLGPYKYWYINYHVYLPKVGYSHPLEYVPTGHRHDWIYASITFSRFSDGLYYRTGGRLSGGNGSGYNHTDIRYDNFYTFSGDDIDQQKGGLGLEHTKVYIGSEAHDVFTEVRRECETQGGCHPYVTHVSDEWRFWGEGGELVDARRGSVEGERLDGLEWGEAVWSPARTQDGWCASRYLNEG